ncbi:MAG: ATP-dependent helicase [Candidatus Sericytochromatia bacterium]|nr:ATP-dependent helicase [Candidatus Sericytochromatia bacterium]
MSHVQGPALVFAVAGAGKTTAMVHRIAHLVQQGHFAASRILATSFSRATVSDLQRALQAWPACDAVHVMTLHAVGRQVLQRAEALGLRQGWRFGAENAGTENRLLKQVLGQARQAGIQVPNPFDEQDFLTYISICKGNFQYPALPAHLPADVQDQVCLATAPESLPDYLALYALFETQRQAQKLLTFDDMLLSAWEDLCCHETLRSVFQQRWDCLLVDEFQDVNAVQYALLDILSAQHRNYMAIGDDDQTIYEWRGASPRFILGFPQQYGAVKYVLHENFRSRAAPLALANRVIAHNQQREPKFLRLTRGFDGQTRVYHPRDEQAQAQQIVSHIMQACQQGYHFEDQAILVRLYAQTPHLEQALIQARIPYQIVGARPFYQRREIMTLRAYLYLLHCENLQSQNYVLTGSQLSRLLQAWQLCANRPQRYLNRLQIQGIAQQLQAGMLLSEVLRQAAAQTDVVYQRKHLEKLAEALTALQSRLQELSAAEVLEALDERIQYRRFLRRHSGLAETGEARAQSVSAFLAYAQQLGSAESLDARLTQLADHALQAHGGVVITSIFRAKGLEWPLVYLPHCNLGYLPAQEGRPLEEERRLFYVGLTRPRENLYLYSLRSLPASPFLAEAAYEQTLSQVQRLQQILTRPVQHWQRSDLLLLAQSQTDLALSNYLRDWWQVPTGLRQKVIEDLSRLRRDADPLALPAVCQAGGS